MNIDIPGFGKLSLAHLVLGYDGTIARDGKLLSNLDKTLEEISMLLSIHVLTTDSCSRVERELAGLHCNVKILNGQNVTEQKQQYVLDLGAEGVVCFGNSANDCLMLKSARLGVAVIEGEGGAASAIHNADIIVRSIYDAMGLLLLPQRIVATLRS